MHRNIPKASFGMTLNGLLPERTEQMIRQILKDNPNIKIHNAGISINGPKEIHDKSRGIPGAFDKAIETYNRIKDLIPVRFSFTYLPYNTEYFQWTRDYARELGTSAYLCWTVMNDRFAVQGKDLNFFKDEIKDHLKKYLEEGDIGTRIIRSYVYDHFIHEQFIQCFAARQFFHLDPEGNIFPCNFKLSDDRILGNIREKSFEDIWESPEKQRVLGEIDRGECIYPNGPCGDSDLTYSVRNNLFNVAGWYAKKVVSGKKLIG
jgi:radical SAM protein with 4Fe4S-binding SPASM domain